MVSFYCRERAAWLVQVGTSDDDFKALCPSHAENVLREGGLHAAVAIYQGTSSEAEWVDAIRFPRIVDVAPESALCEVTG